MTDKLEKYYQYVVDDLKKKTSFQYNPNGDVDSEYFTPFWIPEHHVYWLTNLLGISGEGRWSCNNKFAIDYIISNYGARWEDDVQIIWQRYMDWVINVMRHGYGK